MGKEAQGVFRIAGIRYWVASLLPALIGTTLPFWLRPPNFTFQTLGAIEFLFGTALFHTGFSFLQAWFEESDIPKWPKPRILRYAGVCILLSCVLGLHINVNLRLNTFVYEGIFVVYGFSALFVGVLYVLPPLNFRRRAGGEIVLSYSLGLLPILGAYLVQVGDITRRVYLASLPVVVVTGLWVWIDEIANNAIDEKIGRKTLVILLGPQFSGRFGVLALSMLYCATLFAAVISASVNPLALVTLFLVRFLWKIVVISWKEYSSSEGMGRARNYAVVLHLLTCGFIIVSSLVNWNL
jgi:1,4-dihydroxy-2-naphthoate octaprenyltransferase